MTSSKPYLIRALYEWITDNHLKPHLLINTKHEGIDIPKGYDKDGQIILNISEHAVHNLGIEESAIAFWARFGGTEHRVWIPMHAVLAIYAQENGQGMRFEDTPPEPPKNERPSLKIVK